MRKKSFTKILKIWGVLLVVGVAMSIAILSLLMSSRDFKDQSQKVRADYIVNQKHIIRQEVERVVAMIDYKKSKSISLTKSKIKNRVDVAFAIADNIYSNHINDKSKADVQKLIVDALRNIRFEDGNGYFFISQLDGYQVLVADKPNLEGQNLYNMQDTRGQFVIRDMINIIRENGEGYYWYHWTQPNRQGNDFEKISFARKFEPFDWFIGTGLYVADIENQIKAELLDSIGQIRFGKDQNGYIFVVSYDGVTLMNGTQRHLIGKSAWDVVDLDGVKIVQEERRAVENPDGEFIYYRWNKPSAEKPSPKTSFMKGVVDWQWMVGAGVYLDDIEADIAVMQKDLNRRNKQLLFYFIIIILFVVAFFLLLFDGFVKRLNNDITLLTNFFNKVSVENEPIDRKSIFLLEFDQMASNANMMLNDKILAERQLKMFEAFAESSSQGMGWTDIGGIGVYFNNALVELLGEDDQQSCKGRDVVEDYYLGPEQKKLREEVLPHVLSHGSWNGELMVKRRNGDLVPTRNSIFLIEDVHSDNRFLANIVTDISELKAVEQEKSELSLRLLQSQKMASIGLIAGGVAHDLNNILSGIIGYPELLMGQLPQESSLQEPLRAIHDSGQRAAIVVADLLTVARGVACVKKLEDLNLLVQEYLDSPECQQLKDLYSHITYDLRLNPHGTVIHCSSVHVKKCIMNLVVNGSESIVDEGKIVISIANELVVDDTIPNGEYVVVSVLDSGVGIADHDIDHVFEPFYSKKEMGRSGTGLGLAVVYNTMEDHDGKVVVHSGVGGSCFKLFFPVVNEIIPRAEDCEDMNGTLDHEHVLVVDDEPQLRDLACKILASFGYRVDSVHSGEQAVEFIKQNSVDVVVLDMLMEPGMNGRETYMEMLKINPHQRAVIASGFSESDDVKAALRLGVGCFIKKPYSVAQLGKAVREVLTAGGGG